MNCHFDQIDIANCEPTTTIPTTTTTTSTTTTTTETTETTPPFCNYQEKMDDFCSKMSPTGEGDFLCSRAKEKFTLSNADYSDIFFQLLLTFRRPLRKQLRMRWVFDVSKVKESSFLESDLTEPPLRFLMRVFWKIPI